MKRCTASSTRGATGRGATGRGATARSSARLVLVLALACLVLAPVTGASAQVASGVTMQDGLAYELVWQAPGGEAAVQPVYSGIVGLDVAPDGRVYFAEHHGALQVLDPSTGLATYLGKVSAATHKCGSVGFGVNAGAVMGCPETGLWESGLHGFALAHDFAQTGHVYVSYAVANSSCELPANIQGEKNAGCWHLSRLKVQQTGGTLGAPTLDLTSEKVLLTWPFSRYAPDNPGGRSAAHQGGGIEVLPDGSIVIAVGDNTSHASHGGYGPRDPRPERWYYNGERTSMNPADRRGKLLRVNPDGSVPADNPYVGKVGEYIYGGPVEYDPYILAMGMRNPYRLASDPRTGTVYSGQVGPDARVDDPARGPKGEDELDVIGRADCDEPTATGACPYVAFNGGYPRCVGPGRPYIDFDFHNNETRGVPLDCSEFDEPVLYYHPSNMGSPWPELNTGGGNTIAPGTVYTSEALRDSLLLFDWSRGWLATIPVTEDGTLDVRPEEVRRIATGFMGPIDAAVAPDGSVYVAEFGRYGSASSRIGRIVSSSAAGRVAAPLPGQPGVPWPMPAAAAAAALLVGVGAARTRRQIV
jgi:glucose/arabinose dehydrogenase